MPVDLLSFRTAAALVVAVAFALLCRANFRRALFVFVLAACIPNVILVQLAGGNSVDGLRPVEWLGTVLIGMWLIRRRPLDRQGVFASALHISLLLFLIVAVCSLFLNQFDEAPNVARENVKLSVSLGQLMLFVWAVGLLFVTEHIVDSRAWIERLHHALLLLALPMTFFPLAVAYGRMDWVLWSAPFCLSASPMAMAELFEPRSAGRRCFLLVVAGLPIVVGLAIGKAYWYILGLSALAIISWLRIRRSALLLVPVAALFYVSASYVVIGEPFPVIREAVASEIAQQSLGGRTGRVQLAFDALQVWQNYPMLGVGPGNSWPHLHVFSALDTPHNQLFGLLLELGILGVVAFVMFVAVAFATGFRIWRSCQHPFDRMFALGWLGLFGGFVIGSVTGDVMLPSVRNAGLTTFSQAYLPWIMTGIMLAIPRIEAADHTTAA